MYLLTESAYIKTSLGSWLSVQLLSVLCQQCVLLKCARVRGCVCGAADYIANRKIYKQ